MSRFKKALHSLVSGYLVTMVGVVYSLSSIPIALGYLGKEEFGLWVLILQLLGYVVLVDFGVSMAAPRILIDYKDQNQEGGYSRAISTIWLALLVQGLFIGILGHFGAPLLAGMLNLGGSVASHFIVIMQWQTAILAMEYFFRVYGCVLIANQRLDVINISQCIFFGVSLAVLWICLKLGQGLFSLVYANLLSQVLRTIVGIWFCHSRGIFPGYLRLRPPLWSLFRKVIGLGKDMFVVWISRTMLETLPTITIARYLGLEATAVWSVAGKTYAVIYLMIQKMAEFSMPAFAEMLVRGETVRLRERFDSMIRLTVAFSTYCGISLAVCNGPFLAVWTAGRIHWPWFNDCLLGVLLVISSYVYSQSSGILVTKKITPTQYVYLAEAVVLGVLVIPVIEMFRMEGGLVLRIILSVIITARHVWRRVAELLGTVDPVSYFGLAKPMLKMAAFFGMPSALVAILAAGMHPLPRLVLLVMYCFCYGSIIFVRFGIEGKLRRELIGRLPEPLRLRISPLAGCS